ncbi:MAG: methyl-accepting chemotaxis protein [Bacteroidota bacterium]
MEAILIKLAIKTVVGSIVALVALRLMFKDSMFFKIITLWVISVLLIMANSTLTTAFPDQYKTIYSLPIGIIMVFLLVYPVFKIIRKPLDESLSNLEELSKGNLDINTNKELMDRKDELGRLGQSINLLSQNFKKAITGVKDSAIFMSDASNELSGTAQQLSQGSNEQASASEEVSASMEQMVSNIKQNADNSQETEKIALKASGGMNKLSESANESIVSINKIAEEIKVISDIAFQTNILALNAAVEAASAGEYGKGFAVVASEVRKLAERSKLAADKINELSETSVKITEKTGVYMKETIPEIDKTVKLVQEISTASSEQNNGADQINNAITELNNVTQQNAANSEEMASSSEELSAQAEQLKDLISFFKFASIQDQKSGFSSIKQNVSPKIKKPVEIKTPVNTVQEKPIILDMSDDSGFEKY